MDFRKLDASELAELAEFFVIDVVAVDPEKPTKKELVTALRTAEQPVSDEDYEVFQKAKASNQVKAPELEEQAQGLAEAKAATTPVEPVDTSNYVLVKFEGNNPRLDLAGHTFYKRHPFASVDPQTAEFIIKNNKSFRLALPSEIADYYN